ncbi:MAG: hypothetical protein RL272_1144 [Candidatus Parcubacteria bacterium]|jgi:hypothetical protein
MDSCKYCGGGGTHDPDCPAAVSAVADASAEKRKFTRLPGWLSNREDSDTCRLCHGKSAHEPSCPLADPERPDFNNVALLDMTFVSGDAPMVEKLRAFCKEHGMTDEKIDLAMDVQRLRRETHAAMRTEVLERMTRNPMPTAEELSMGAYVERIEPQVREAVLAMRRKGYSTSSSGFNILHYQSMSLSEPDLLKLDAAARERLAALGVAIDKGGNGLHFESPSADMDDLKKSWDEIADALPDLKRAAPPASHGAAEDLRQAYEEWSVGFGRDGGGSPGHDGGAAARWLDGKSPSGPCPFCAQEVGHGKDCPIADRENPRFSNSGLGKAVLLSDDAALLEKYREFMRARGVSDARFDAARALQKLRLEVHARRRAALKERKRTAPEATEEELSMGAYAEQIEETVRDAVLKTRRKGYGTASSGFTDFDEQRMVFSESGERGFDAETRGRLESLGVAIHGNGSLSFRCAEADPSKIKAAWDAIADALPDLGRPAPAATHDSAMYFRLSQLGRKKNDTR